MHSCLCTVVETQIQDYFGQQGHFLKLSCNTLKNYPPPKYTWVTTESVMSIDVSLIQEDNRVFIDHEGV